jgi:hypothetical protein
LTRDGIQTRKSDRERYCAVDARKRSARNPSVGNGNARHRMFAVMRATIISRADSSHANATPGESTGARSRRLITEVDSMRAGPDNDVI